MAARASRARPYSRSNMNAIGIDSTPSLLYNNLSSNGDRAAYIHKSRVLLFNEAASDSKVETDIISIKDLTNVTQVKWVSPAGSPQLFVCMGSGIQVYETKQEHTSTRMAMLFSDPLCERMEAAEGIAKYCRGVAAFGDRGDVAVGTFTGEIAVYRGGEIQNPLLTGHSAPICCIESSPDYWVSSDNAGTIIAWTNAKEVACTFAGDGFPCTSVVTRDKTVVGGFACGHVRIFRIGNKAPLVEIAAHARCVTGMAIHPSLPMFATVGEDTVLSVFNIPEDGEDVDVAFTTTVTDRLLTGVQFSQRDPKSSDVMVAAYDSHSVSVWISA